MKLKGNKSYIIRTLQNGLKDGEVYIVDFEKVLLKRSLNANAFYWVLLSQYAKWANESIVRAHNRMLQHYGEIEVVNGEPRTMKLPKWVDIDAIQKVHLKFYFAAGDYQVCFVMRGSHTYNTKEMNRLINGLILDIVGDGADTDININTK